MRFIFKLTFALLLLVLAGFNIEQAGAQLSLPVIPKPYATQQTSNDSLRLTDSIRVTVDSTFDLDQIQAMLSIYQKMNQSFFNEIQFEVTVGFNLTSSPSTNHHIEMRMKKNDQLDDSDAYRLVVDARGIEMEAKSESGLFYALQTLHLSSSAKNRNEIPCLEINDKPRFEYRGLMLDVSRFFIPKEEVLRIIDCMSMLKLNKLHLHLTDDNGWRIEIKKYPELTKTGAWRVNRNNQAFPDRSNPEKEEPTPIGGFYTQEDIKEMVRYAQKRYVEIIPEIDMPGHTNAVLASYPQLACPSVDRPIQVVPGMGEGSGSIILCAGNDETFTFIENVLDELIKLFPSRYIHIGGDEAWKDYWKKCPRCAERMRKEQISHIEELQSYFMNRVSQYVQSKGKSVMGWDELTNGTLPKDIIIFGWQGMGTAALKAAAQGHRFVMTPAKLLYLIRYQGPQWFEPLTYFGNNTLKDIYQYEPVQSEWDPLYEHLLMGVQASLWTEFCQTSRDVYHQLFPRLIALSEVAWSPKQSKDWKQFVNRLDHVLFHLRAKGINYSEAMFNIQHKAIADQGRVKVDLTCERPDVEIRYTIDGMEPDASSSIYTFPLLVDNTTEIRCATFQNGVKKGETLQLKINWNLATGRKISSSNPTAQLLTNGIRGSKKQSDFEWTDWYTREDVSFILDLGQEKDIQKVTLGALSYYGMGVNKPKQIEIQLSADGTNYRKSTIKTFTEQEIFKVGNFIEDIVLEIPDGKAVRYILVNYQYPGDCPSGHLKYGQQSRCRLDEIIVE